MLVGPAPAASRGGKGVHDRPRPGFEVELVEAPQHGLAVRPGGCCVLRARSCLSGETVRGSGRPGRRGSAGRPRAFCYAPVGRPDRLRGSLEPPGEVPRLHSRGLVPGHFHRPQEPEPTQQRHPVGALRGLRPAGAVEVRKKSGHRGNRVPRWVKQPIGLEGVPCRLECSLLGNYQCREIPRPVLGNHGKGP